MNNKNHVLVKAVLATAMAVSMAPFMKPNVALAYNAVEESINNTASKTTDTLLVSEASYVAKIGETEYTSLKEAVEQAKDGDTVVVGQSLKVTEEIKVVNKTITIKGVTDVTLSRSEDYLNGYLLNIDENSTVNLENIHFDGGASEFTAGEEVVKNKKGYIPITLGDKDLKATKSMVYTEGHLKAKNSSFKNAVNVTRSGHGGAILVEKGTAEFTNCQIQHNVVYNSWWACGGAIYANQSDSLIFRNTNIDQNYASYSESSYCFGGAIFAQKGVMEFYGGTINDNSASENGGAVYANYPVTKVTMENVEVSRNASGNDGGAVHLMKADGDFTNCKFIDNKGMAQSGTSLGVICYAYGNGTGNIVGCTFKGNREEGGSAVANFGNQFTLNIDQCKFEENHEGSVLYLSSVDFTLTNSTFKSNEDTSVQLLSSITPEEYKEENAKYLKGTIENCQFLENKYVDISVSTYQDKKMPYTAYVKDCLIDGQNVESGSRAINVSRGSIVTLDNTEIKNKHADDWNGVAIGSYGDGSTVNLTNHTRIYNNKGTSAAGVAVWSGGLVNIDETSKVYDNDSSRYGDDLYVRDKDSTITFYKNSVVGEKLSGSCGHMIDGWYIDNEGNRYDESSENINKFDAESEKVILTDKEKYGLKAAHGLYTVTYNSNYGDMKENKTDKFAPGETVELEKNLYEREGYVFVGWNTKADGTGDTYSYNPKTGEFEGTFEVPAHDVTLYAQWALNMVTINAAPTIKAEDKVVTVGDKFDPMAGVTAKDAEDGDLTDKIEITKNTVDLTKAGTYEITYEVKDKEGNKATKTITVTVKEKDVVKPDTNKGGSTNTPKTGDTTQVGFFALLVSCAAALLNLLKRKKA